MITQPKALEALAEVRKIQNLKHQNDDFHTVAEWILIIERQLQKAKDEWTKGGPRSADHALERIAHVGACAVACLEQNVNSC